METKDELKIKTVTMRLMNYQFRATRTITKCLAECGMSLKYTAEIAAQIVGGAPNSVVSFTKFLQSHILDTEIDSRETIFVFDIIQTYGGVCGAYYTIFRPKDDLKHLESKLKEKRAQLYQLLKQHKQNKNVFKVLFIDIANFGIVGPCSVILDKSFESQASMLAPILKHHKQQVELIFKTFEGFAASYTFAENALLSSVGIGISTFVDQGPEPDGQEIFDIYIHSKETRREQNAKEDNL